MKGKLIICIMMMFSVNIMYASFPVDVNQGLVELNNSEPFKFNFLGFGLGLASILLLPWSLISLFFLNRMESNFKKSMGIGAIVGSLIILILSIFVLIWLGGLDWKNLIVY